MKLHTIEPGESALHLRWADGARDTYPYIWLRMNSRDPSTRHPGTGQILLSVADLDARAVTPAEVTRSADQLLIRWPDMDQPSAFSLSWLRQHASNRANRAALDQRADTYPEIQPWLPADAADMPVVDYRALAPDASPKASGDARRSLMSAFCRYGFVRVRGLPAEPGQVARLVRALGGYVRATNYGVTFQVIAEDDPTHLAYSSMPLALHTDMGYRDCTPGVQFLHCLVASGQGGESLLADGVRICADLWADDPQAFYTLAHTPVSFRYRDERTELYDEKTLIELHPRTEPAPTTAPTMGADRAGARMPRIRSLYFNERTLQPVVLHSPAAVASFYDAYRKLVRLVRDPRYTFEFKLAPGDVLIFHNRRILHGRRGYQADDQNLAPGRGPIRHLEGCYADLDAFLSEYRLLAR